MSCQLVRCRDLGEQPALRGRVGALLRDAGAAELSLCDFYRAEICQPGLRDTPLLRLI